MRTTRRRPAASRGVVRAAAVAAAVGMIAAGAARAAVTNVCESFADARPDRAAVVAAIQKTQAATSGEVRISEFDEMILAATDLDGAALGKFIAAVKAREKLLGDWEKTAEGRRHARFTEQAAAARQAGETNKVAALAKEAQALNDEHVRLRKQGRALVLNALTLEQQRKWAVEMMWSWWGGLPRHFAKAKLTEAQVAKAKDIIREAMKDYMVAGVAEKDPYFFELRSKPGSETRTRIIERIASKVLTEEQRKDIAPATAASAK